MDSSNYYRVKAILQKIPVNRATIWRWCKDGHFPKPFRLGKKCTVWNAAEVDAWIKAQRQDEDAGAK